MSKVKMIHPLFILPVAIIGYLLIIISFFLRQSWSVYIMQAGLLLLLVLLGYMGLCIWKVTHSTDHKDQIKPDIFGFIPDIAPPGLPEVNSTPKKNLEVVDKSESERIRICASCGHLENQHKWYAQNEEDWDGEEHWECRYHKGDDYCVCEVGWVNHNFVDITGFIAAELAKARIEESKIYLDKKRWYYPSGYYDPYIPVRQIEDRIKQLQSQQTKEEG